MMPLQRSLPMSQPQNPPLESDADRRARIINHINTSHKPELSRYLRHFASATSQSSVPKTCTLVDISHTRMLIRASDAHEHTIPFDPPLQTWSDVRPRVVEMDAQARKALNEDTNSSNNNDKLTQYAPPTGHGAVVFGSVLFYFVCRATLHLVTPGTKAWELIEEFWPGGVEWYAWVVRTIFWPTVILHTGEAVIFDRIRMERYGVNRGSGLWWKWMLNVWIEGITTFGRAEVVAEKNRKKR